jgi:hypothetical protein
MLIVDWFWLFVGSKIAVWFASPTAGWSFPTVTLKVCRHKRHVPARSPIRVIIPITMAPRKMTSIQLRLWGGCNDLVSAAVIVVIFVSQIMIKKWLQLARVFPFITRRKESALNHVTMREIS